jgi:ElaB/YqjD/DUF883 family membrane-anchored ribosome-binding protein
MSIITSIESLIAKLDPNATHEIEAVKTDIEDRLAKVPAIVDQLRSDVTAAAEALKTQTASDVSTAVPGLEAALTAAVDKAETDLKQALGLL